MARMIRDKYSVYHVRSRALAHAPFGLFHFRWKVEMRKWLVNNTSVYFFSSPGLLEHDFMKKTVREKRWSARVSRLKCTRSPRPVDRGRPQCPVSYPDNNSASRLFSPATREARVQFPANAVHFFFSLVRSLTFPESGSGLADFRANSVQVFPFFFFLSFFLSFLSLAVKASRKSCWRRHCRWIISSKSKVIITWKRLALVFPVDFFSDPLWY